MARQTYDKNLEDLNNFRWSNLMKLISGEVTQQFFRNWLDSTAEGLLNNGDTIEEAIEKLRTVGGGGEFSEQFKLIQDVIWWDPSRIKAIEEQTQVIKLTKNGYPYSGVILLYNLDDPFPVLQGEQVTVNYDIRLVSGTITPAPQMLEFSPNVGGDRQEVTLTSTFQNVTNLSTIIPSDYNTTQLRLIITNDTDITDGTVIEIRNLKIYKPDGSLVELPDPIPQTAWTNETSGGTSPIKGTRVQILDLKEAGQLPTIPTATDPHDEDWLDTDILPFELAVNFIDRILYTSDGTTIIPLAGGSGATNFDQLSDTPSSKTGQNGKKVTVDEATGKLVYTPSTTSSGFYTLDNLINFDGTILTLSGTNKFVTVSGKEYSKTNDTFTPALTPENRLIYIYYDDDGTLKQANNPNRSEQYNLFITKLPVAYLLYNDNVSLVTFVGDYRKGRSGNAFWAKNLYDVPIRTLSGLTYFGLTGGNGNADADARFGLSEGELILADREFNSPTRQPEDTWNVGFFDTDGREVGVVANAFPVLTDVDLGVGTTGRLVYNNDGNPAAIPNNDYVWYFVAISADIKGVDRTVMFMGNNNYGNANQARNNLELEIAIIESSLNIRQGLSLQYAVLYQTQDNNTNAVKAHIIEIQVISIVGSNATPGTSIPEDLINGGDASSLHNHNSLYARPIPNYQDGDLVDTNALCEANGYVGYSLEDANSDALTPATSGVVEKSIQDSDTFATAQNTSVVRMTHRYTLKTNLFFRGIEIRSPFYGLDTLTRVTVTNETTGEQVIESEVIQAANQWISLGTRNRVGVTGEVLRVDYDIYNAQQGPGFTGGWTSIIGTGTPAVGQLVIDSASNPTLLRYNHEDLDGTNRQTELNGLTLDSIIDVVETSSQNRNFKVKVTSITPQTGYTDYAVTLISKDNDIRDNETTTTTATGAVNQPTQYNVITDYYVTQPDFADVVSALQYDGVDQAADPTDAYGIRILIEKATFSSKWKYLVIPGGSSGGSPSEPSGDVTDYENVLIRDTGEFWGTFRPFNWRIKTGSKIDTGGIATITTSSDAPYTIGDTVTANDYLKVVGDTELMRTSFIIEEVI